MTSSAVVRPPELLPGEHTIPEWYALAVRSQHEFKVSGALRAMAIESFLPSWQEKVQWSDRAKTIHRPLLPGYVFLRTACPDELHAALLIAGVIQFLPSSLMPEPIPAAEIETVRRVAATKLSARPCEYVEGDEVLIDSGPLAGVKGRVVRTRGAVHVVVLIEMLQRAVRVELDAATLLKAVA